MKKRNGIGCAVRIRLILFAFLSYGTLAHCQSARRFMDFTNGDDLTTSKFYLLERLEVQRELNLTTGQVTTVATAFNTPYEKIPGLSEWRARYQSLSPEEKRETKQRYREDRNTITSKWFESQLANILSGKQRDRLDALLLQMKGPRAIAIIPGLMGKLGLTPEQTLKITNITNECRDELSPFLQRFGHNMFQRSRRSQTLEESEKEQDALVVIITEILKSQDESILAELTKAQCDQWRVMQGNLLPVAWPETAGFYVPFHTEEKASSRVKESD